MISDDFNVKMSEIKQFRALVRELKIICFTHSKNSLIMNQQIAKRKNENKNQETNNVVDPVLGLLSELRNSFPEEDTSKMEASLRMALSYDHNHEKAPETSTLMQQKLNKAFDELQEDPEKWMKEMRDLDQIISNNPSLEQELLQTNQQLGTTTSQNQEFFERIEELERANNTQKLIIRGGKVTVAFLVTRYLYKKLNNK